MFKSFVNPANWKYAWFGLEVCEEAYLNDSRWSLEIISWNDFLLLLESQIIHLPRPKNINATDLFILRDSTLPVFATEKSPVEYICKRNVRDSFYDVYWCHLQILINDIKNIHPALKALVFR